jgi:hypothetical protein
MRTEPKDIERPAKVEFEQNLLEHYLEEIQDKNTFSSFPEIDFNPFLCNMNDMLKKGYKSDPNVYGVARADVADPNTGEMIPLSAPIKFGRVQIIEPSKFVKVYGDTLKDMFSLSGPAYKVYGYFISEMIGKPKVTEIYFRLQGCMEFTKYSGRSNIYLGLCELIKAGFIAKTNRPPSFYINPLYAFNGSMVETYNRYILEGSKDEREFIAAQSEPGNMLLENYELTNTDNNENE